ncbi:T9SS type A sorting domain-containing protein [Pseudoflavitalea sp. X16]|uniref:T9SS type A sorting domain-containing protein n=1 Tax=Paraflavitalea devenefica TaxID=2716334 RepID=UPI0014215F1E|nr:T9SS type A sorting domain-containing protein [Paraflavitalea devenefica]NII26065.1 T9SS type A sorting domain-containing protein [Paraflavitalea devenefica]
MKRVLRDILIIVFLLSVSLLLQAQRLDVTVTNVGGNKIQFMGTATGAGFATAPNNAWGDMNLTWRIPKAAALPAPPTPPPAPPTPPAATPEVTLESTAFTGTAPEDVFTGGTDLAIFDLTTFGGIDDGYWYFQVTGTANTVQNIPSGGTVLVYEFKVPSSWSCPNCVEVLTTDIPELMTLAGISTTSFIHNGGLNVDVLNLVTNMAPLPVAWLYVKAEPKDNKWIEVKWATATEQNNAGFAVERSDDGGRTWQAIASVPGNGNASTPSYYSIRDEQVTAGVKYYYRIKQTDFDGRIRHSAIATALLTGEQYFTVVVKPNPVRDQLNLELQSAKKQTAQVVITDMAGKLYRVERGINMQAVTTRFSCNVAGYPSGMYIAKVIAEDGSVQAVKFMISR